MNAFFPDNKLVIATHNPGKVREMNDLLQPYGIACVSSLELGLPEPVEDGATFEENALIKARSAAKESGLTALADDSGLSVRALNGDPGIYSARWAGPDKDFDLAMRKVNDALGDADDRGASFHCVLALCTADGQAFAFDGEVKGEIVWPPRGDKGFGYDPVFVADGMTQTFAEIDPVEKHAMSHRAKAFQLFSDRILSDHNK